MARCKHKWIDAKREGSGRDLKIYRKCEICGEESVRMPNLLVDVFGIRGGGCKKWH